MIVLGLILSIFAIGFFCWLLFTLAVYALPVYIAMLIGFAAYHHGYGPFDCILIAIASGVAVLFLGRLVFAWARLPVVRAAIALMFAAPAAIAGYYGTAGIAQICIADGSVITILAIVGAALVGGTAWSRLAVFPPSSTGEGPAGNAGSPPFSATAAR